MNIKRTFLLASAIAMCGLLSAPSYAEEHFDCDAHAAHIDHEIGAKAAIEAYHILHGDTKDEHHTIDKLKEEHPDIEHELEEYTKNGCTDAELRAHAHDDD